MGLEYPLKPRRVPRVETKYRRIVTSIPVPESLPVLRTLQKYEPRSMRGQPTVVGDSADGVLVRDAWGNQWIDWSCGVLVATAGHGRQEIIEAVCRQARNGLLHNYCFPSEIRARLVERLVELAPRPLEKCFLLTTGGEATENAIKLARTWGHRVGGAKKLYFVTFSGAFHGRTLGAQLAGGIPALKEWIGPPDPFFIQVPYPGDWRTKEKSFRAFEQALERQGVLPREVCGVMSETYQGGTGSFMPVAFVRALKKWCTRHKALLIFDEIQACFGRTGKMFGFEHYGVVPDLTCLGKGITSSLPLACVLGRKDVMEIFEPGAMTSTHTGNPICCAAALENLELIVREDLPGRSARLGRRLHAGLARLARRHKSRVGHLDGRGLVAALQIVRGKKQEPDGKAAFEIVRRCVEQGLLLFSPVGPGGAAVKISPPLIITEDALDEGLEVLGKVMRAVLGAGR